MPFAPPTVTGFNANPPEDDGTAAASNEVEWQKHLDKIGSPLKTAIEALMTELTRWIDNDAVAQLVTAADVLTKIKTVDGAGSGLDADTLDALSSAAFAQVANNLSDVTAATAFSNIKQAASTTATGVAELAIASEMVTGTDAARVPSVSVVKNHEGVAKAWGSILNSGSASIEDSHGVTSVSRTAAGIVEVTLAVTMANDDYAVIITSGEEAEGHSYRLTDRTTTTFTVMSEEFGGTDEDSNFSFVVFGTLA